MRTNHIKVNERKYIIWQNRAVQFYLAARLLYSKRIFGPAAYCATQALENLLKGTLLYWDRSFTPEVGGHKFRAMINAAHNKVPDGKGIVIPEYFFADKRYQSVSRYPTPGKGVGIVMTFRDDLDRSFVELIKKVPFQFNSNLVSIVGGKNRTAFLILRSRNKQTRMLRTFLKPWLPA